MRAPALAAAPVALAILLASGCGGGNGDAGRPSAAPNTMRLTSPAFRDGGRLPVRFTCDGKGVSPAFDWSKRPLDTKSQALTLEDPDAPGGTFVHWVVWGMMARTTGLQADIAPGGLPEARTSAGDAEYAPPCPPKGDPPHRYVFTIYALKERIATKPGAPASDALAAIARAALARGTLTAKYSR